MKHYLTEAWSTVRAIFQPDVDTIIRSFLKAQDKLEKLINRELLSVEAETRALIALEALRAEREARIARSQRIIGNLKTLVA
jgi:hypothetical protein